MALAVTGAGSVSSGGRAHLPPLGSLQAGWGLGEPYQVRCPEDKEEEPGTELRPEPRPLLLVCTAVIKCDYP